jgi:hypothetical protein
MHMQTNTIESFLKFPPKVLGIIPNLTLVLFLKKFHIYIYKIKNKNIILFPTQKHVSNSIIILIWTRKFASTTMHLKNTQAIALYSYSVLIRYVLRNYNYNHQHCTIIRGKILYQESRGKSGQTIVQSNATDSTHFSKISNYCIEQFMESGRLHGLQTDLFPPSSGTK